MYEYYFQDKNGGFSLIDTFPLQHGMLAEDINITNKTTTQSIIGCCKVNNNVYRLTNNGNWKTSSQQREIGKKKLSKTYQSKIKSRFFHNFTLNFSFVEYLQKRRSFPSLYFVQKIFGRVGTYTV